MKLQSIASVLHLTLKRYYKSVLVLSIFIFTCSVYLSKRAEVVNSNATGTPANVQTKIPKQLQPVDINKYFKQPVTDAEVHGLGVHFREMFKTHSFNCPNRVYLGVAKKRTNAGYWYCISEGFHPSPPCLVYSFGISNDFGFEDDVSTAFGCHVYAFDPTNGMKPHNRSDLIHFYDIGLFSEDTDDLTFPEKTVASDSLQAYNTIGHWKVRKFGTILKEFNHIDKTIDYFKADIEVSDAFAFTDLINSGLLRNVKQIGGEFHPMHLGGFEVWSPILHGLFDQGFRVFAFAAHNSTAIAKGFNNLFEFQMINLNFIDT